MVFDSFDKISTSMTTIHNLEEFRERHGHAGDLRDHHQVNIVELAMGRACTMCGNSVRALYMSAEGCCSTAGGADMEYKVNAVPPDSVVPLPSHAKENTSQVSFRDEDQAAHSGRLRTHMSPQASHEHNQDQLGGTERDSSVDPVHVSLVSVNGVWQQEEIQRVDHDHGQETAGSHQIPRGTDRDSIVVHRGSVPSLEDVEPQHTTSGAERDSTFDSEAVSLVLVNGVWQQEETPPLTNRTQATDVPEDFNSGNVGDNGVEGNTASTLGLSKGDASPQALGLPVRDEKDSLEGHDGSPSLVQKVDASGHLQTACNRCKDPMSLCAAGNPCANAKPIDEQKEHEPEPEEDDGPKLVTTVDPISRCNLSNRCQSPWAFFSAKANTAADSNAIIHQPTVS